MSDDLWRTRSMIPGLQNQNLLSEMAGSEEREPYFDLVDVLVVNFVQQIIVFQSPDLVNTENEIFSRRF